MAQRIDGLLASGLQGEEDIATCLVRLGTEHLIQDWSAVSWNNAGAPRRSLGFSPRRVV
jgi:hypothetical protein